MKIVNDASIQCCNEASLTFLERNEKSAILKRINISLLFYPGVVVLTSDILLCHVLMKPVAHTLLYNQMLRTCPYTGILDCRVLLFLFPHAKLTNYIPEN